VKFGFLVLVLFGLLFYLWLRGATQLFVLEVAQGRVRFRRGRMPPSLLSELKDVLRGTRVEGTVAAVTDRGDVRVVARGDFDEGTLQQVRNVVGRYPLARIRAGSPPRA
jgi:hypothetical protein